MIQRLFSNETKTITGAAILIGTASLLSRLIGIIRDRLFAHLFGAGEVLDAYYAAFRIPDAVYNLLILGALSAGFIPVFTQVWKNNKEEAWRITNGLIVILGASLVAVCGILFLVTPFLIRFLVPGFDEGQQALAVTLTRIMFISPLLLGVSGIVSGVLQSLKSFLVYALTPIMYNIGIIIGALIFVPMFGPIGLAFGVVLGALFHFIIQLPALAHHGFRWRLAWLPRHPKIREIFFLMIPRTLGLASFQINLIAITILASTLKPGSIAVFNFANNLQYVPIGLFGISFAVAAFPTFADLYAEGKKDAFISHIARTTKQILFFIVPAMVGYLLLRAQIVRVVLGTGAFDWSDTIATADALAFFSLSFFAQALILLLARAFYAMKDTWTPFLGSALSTIVTVGAAVFFKEPMGVAGLAFAFSLGMMAQFFFLWIALHRKLGTLEELSIVHALYKITIAALAMGVLIQFLKAPVAARVDMERLWGILTQMLVAGGFGLLVYGSVCHLLRLEEIALFAQSMKKRWLKLTRVQGEIREADEL